MPQPSLHAELKALRQRVIELERRPALEVPHRPRRGLALAFLVAAAIVVTGTAFAATGNCPNGLPFCFAADTPAQASQVNHNFMQLKEWLETKVGAVSAGAVGSGTVTAAAVNAATITSTGNITAGGTVAAATVNTSYVNAGGTIRSNALSADRGMEIDWNRTGGTGESDLTNFFEGGVGGFNFYNAASVGSARTLLLSLSAAGSVTAAGAITAAGAVTASGVVTDNAAAARKSLRWDFCGDLPQTTMCPANMYVCGMGIWGTNCRRMVCCRLGHDGVSL